MQCLLAKRIFFIGFLRYNARNRILIFCYVLFYYCLRHINIFADSMIRAIFVTSNNKYIDILKTPRNTVR